MRWRPESGSHLRSLRSILSSASWPWTIWGQLVADRVTLKPRPPVEHAAANLDVLERCIGNFRTSQSLRPVTAVLPSPKAPVWHTSDLSSETKGSPMSTPKPSVFMGSSTESWPVAQKVGQRLEKNALVRQWKRVFIPGEYPLERLQSEARNVDFAVFVLAPDDMVRSRRRDSPAPRDNVIFEAGMFLTALGRERTFLVEDASSRLKLPSDVIGVTTLRYSGSELKPPRPNWQRLHHDVSDTLAERIDHLGPLGESGLSEAIIRVFTATSRIDTRLPLSVISARHSSEIVKYLDTLFNENHLDRHAVSGMRLRRVFEDSGQYLEGIRVNQKVVKSLKALSRTDDARWMDLKGVAYLQVLAGNHGPARERLAQLLTETEVDPEPNRLLRAYAHRYLAISYHRDLVSRNLRLCPRRT